MGSLAKQEKDGAGANYSGKLKDMGERMRKLARDDPRRIHHCLKLGLSLTLVSLIVYLQPLYDSFGDSGVWAVITVVVLSEFTLGATICKGLNRAFATTIAGGLAVAAKHLALLFGEIGEPIVLAFLVFLLAAMCTFFRFFPYVKERCDYGCLIFILTFSMISVSAYRFENFMELGKERIVTIIIGGTVCMVVSICVCPVWAGGDLHNLIFRHLEKLALDLEELGEEYFQKGFPKDSKKPMDRYTSVLTSKASEASLANFARWEPAHGEFRFRHPWQQYLKIGALARQCAYKIDALSCFTTSDIRAPLEMRENIRESSKRMSSESSKALKEMATAIKKMTDPSPSTSHLKNSISAINELKESLKCASVQNNNILGLVSAATVGSILIEIVKCVEEISKAVQELSEMAHFKKVEPIVSEKSIALLHRGMVKPVYGGGDGRVVIIVHDTPQEHLVPKPVSQGGGDGNVVIIVHDTPQEHLVPKPVSQGGGDGNVVIIVHDTPQEQEVPKPGQ